MGKDHVEVEKIECNLEAGFYYFITDLHGVTTKKNEPFRAACQYKTGWFTLIMIHAMITELIFVAGRG